MKLVRIYVMLAMIALILAPAADTAEPGTQFLVLCYHDVPAHVYLDNYAVDQASFIDQIEYLRTHGYHFISVKDITRANQGKKPLPDKAVLLTFDDAYRSFYSFVYPVLKLYGYPCMVGIVGEWITNKPPDDLTAPLMTWKEIKGIAKDPLVEIASHTDNLHQSIQYNPQGNTNPAAVSLRYDPETKTYESEKAYRSRIRRDLIASRRTLEEKTGRTIRSLVWPYGQYNTLALREAEKAGFNLMFTAEGIPAQSNNIREIHRFMITNNPAIQSFIGHLDTAYAWHPKHRVVQADLDLIYDPDPVQQEKNLDIFIERLTTMKPSTVYLQAFCDAEGSGNIASVYFPNTVLPMRADLFNRVVNQLAIRGIQVYAWMPMLSITLPEEHNELLRVKEFKDGVMQSSTSWYKRLSPFSVPVREKLALLYREMAAHAQIAGVVFHDDGYLNDFEDFSEEALEEYRRMISQEVIPVQQLNEQQRIQWTAIKTRKLIELTQTLKEAVLTFRPNARFARTLYAPVLTNPSSEEWFAQNYDLSLESYDFVVVMAYPLMEKVRNPHQWLKQLVEKAKEHPEGLKKTIFKVQSYDWEKKQPINTDTLNAWLRVLVASGAQHIGYYPDNYLENHPDEKIIRLMMSMEDYPFERR